MSNTYNPQQIIRPVFPANSPRIDLSDEYKYYSKAIEIYEKKAINSFVIENYLYEENEILVWWFLYKEKYEFKSPMNIFEFLGTIQSLYNNNGGSYLDCYYKQLYFAEPDPAQIQSTKLENDTTQLRKQAFKNYTYLKTLFPEIEIFHQS